MTNLKTPMTTVIAGLFASTAFIGVAQAAGEMVGDANGDVLIKPTEATQAEVTADAPATAAEKPLSVTGDANGEVLVQPSASVNVEAAADAPVDAPKDMVGDANGDEPIPSMADNS